ncbi:oxygenase MpaB family protein [Arcticibacter eurypsychrophilus]|uniref:oxygenase MpaB family protein n=1 Tax=Arcticibacter eurypsychrophilus TaxID=1434752 RepID=UPI00084DB540|nr:oxygenase MpaB family protein [Arcticibacter eurypsychrophilus]
MNTQQQQYSNQFLSIKRLKGDVEVESFIDRNFSDLITKTALSSWLSQVQQNSSMTPLPDEYLGEAFMRNAQTLPLWADRKRMKNGSRFFVQHAEQIMQLLGLLSLPYCYAAADGAMVLYLTERLKSNAGKRLTDTAGFIWDVMAPNAFEIEGKGFASCLKIRLTHAAARYYTLRSGKWDSTLGFPINQEDMAGTNLSFSLIVIRGLRKLGHSISYEEQQSFLHLWNVIGYLLGLEDDLITQDGKSAHALELAIRNRHFKTSEQGSELTRVLISYFDSVTPSNISLKDTHQLMRYLLGDKIANLLNIPNSSIPLYLPYLLKIASHFPNLEHKVSYKQKYNSFIRKTA